MSEAGPRTFRDHLLSIFQSAAAELARQAPPERGGTLEPPEAAVHGASRIQRAATAISERHAMAQAGLPAASASKPSTAEVCARLGLRYLEAKLAGNAALAAQLEGQLKDSACDPGWATTLTRYLEYFGPDGRRRAIPYVTPAQAGGRVVEIPAGASLALVSDWGTGAAPAASVMRLIAARRPDVLVHLGDIYYSGTPTECDVNFARLVDAAFGGARPPVFTLSGNHDMYAGGVGFYELIARLNPAPMTQPASFFCLRAADAAWQLLAMDTGLHADDPFAVDHAPTRLEPAEIDWHVERVREFPGRTILLSHHPLFSAFSGIGPVGPGGRHNPCNPNLRAVLDRLAAAGDVSAWFWGHEHALRIYEPYAGLAKGRCIGYGAIPVFVGEDEAPLAGLAEPPAVVPGAGLSAQGDVRAHGFVRLALGRAGAPAVAEYLEDDGGRERLVYSEAIGEAPRAR